MGNRPKCAELKHPNQPIGWDGPVLRFKANEIVQHLVDGYPGGLNAIAAHWRPTSQDYSQLMQLIGYSVSGYGDLDVPPETVAAADKIAAWLVEESNG